MQREKDLFPQWSHQDENRYSIMHPHMKGVANLLMFSRKQTLSSTMVENCFHTMSYPKCKVQHLAEDLWN
jgi:hypothetical protein